MAIKTRKEGSDAGRNTGQHADNRSDCGNAGAACPPNAPGMNPTHNPPDAQLEENRARTNEVDPGQTSRHEHGR